MERKTTSNTSFPTPDVLPHVCTLPTPRFPVCPILFDCAYFAQELTSAWSAGNSLVFGEYICKALFNHEPPSLVLKLTSFACLTLTFVLHGTTLKLGLRLQNAIGMSKLIVILIIIGTGYVALREGIPTESGLPQDRWRARKNFSDIWDGTNRNWVALCTALYSVGSFLYLQVSPARSRSRSDIPHR